MLFTGGWALGGNRRLLSNGRAESWGPESDKKNTCSSSFTEDKEIYRFKNRANAIQLVYSVQ